MNDPTGRAARILDAAVAQFLHYGYDKTTMSAIAEQVGISKAAIYLDFPSKEALFEGLLLREIGAYSDRWFARIDADPRGGTIDGIFRAVQQTLAESPVLLALFKRDRAVLGAYLTKPTAVLTLRGAVGIRAEFVARMQEVGAIRGDLDTRSVAIVLNMLSFGLAHLDQVADDDPPALDDLLRTVGAIFDSGLSNPTVDGSAAGKAVIAQMRAAVDATLASAQTTSSTSSTSSEEEEDDHADGQ